MTIRLLMLNKLAPEKRQEYLSANGRRQVYIHSDNGIWRSNAMGYTNDYNQAGVYSLSNAYLRTSHCGPEKKVHYEFLRNPITTL